MQTRQRGTADIGPPPTTIPPLEVVAATGTTTPGEPEWLWESLRYRFWQPTDLARSIRRAGPFSVEQREAIAYWWSLPAAVERLGPRAYAAAFVHAAERHDSDQVRWSLLAMLRDELQHEQLCRMVVEGLAPGWPFQYAPRTTLGRQGIRHLRDVYEEAERCWDGYRRVLAQDGIGVASGALLLGALVTGDLYERWATGCTIPAFATAFRHSARDAQRHQAVLRALATWDWPLLEAAQRSEAARQVQASARLLSSVMLGAAARLPGPSGDVVACLPACEDAARQAGLGVPSAEQRQELLRAALLEVRDLQERFDIPFPAMPSLAILGTETDTRQGRPG